MTSPTLLASALLAALCMALPAHAASAAPKAKPDLARGEAASATCLACHTADGSRGTPENPILQGQFPEYLATQLKHFRSGKRQNAVMQGMAAAIAEEDIPHIAAFYASKEPKPGFAKNKDTVLLGEKIYRGGIAERSIPACAGCHGPNGAGIPVQYPRLAGQHAAYTEAQLVAFRSGARANNEAMTGVAARLNDREIKALADYIAGLR